MICPHCKSENKKSFLYEGLCFTTAMGFQSFYDEDGNYHSHNGNRTSTAYNCSNGHSFSVSVLTQCPSCDFGKDSQKITLYENTLMVTDTSGELKLS